MPETRVWVDARADGLHLSLDIPLNRLEFAFGQPLADEATQVLPRHEAALQAYLLAHVRARSGDLAWRADPPRLAVQGRDASAELQAELTLHPPPGADPRALTLVFDAVTHEVRTHRVQFFLRSDWAGGVAAQVPRPLAVGDSDHTVFELKLGPPRAGGAWWPLLQAGAHHILEGADHLLFLLMLMVAAPLVARHGRWADTRRGRDSWREVAIIVSAFTLGHTLTLVLGSTGVLQPPASLVEVGVAASIVLAALHAAKPLWSGAERAMALAFGLVHGLAFSASLSGAGLTMGQHAQALLAFNLGIEAAQLGLVALALPALLLAQTAGLVAYARLRLGLATLGGALALWWVAERLDMALPWRLPEPTAFTPVWALLGLWAVALLTRGRGRGRGVRPAVR